MILLDDALRLLREAETRQWLIASWDWHSSGKGNGGMYIGLIQPDMKEKALSHLSWDVYKGKELTGFSTWSDEDGDHAEYGYAPAHGYSWPLIIHRNFYDLAEEQCDLLEEFRLYHNLWHDRKTDNYYKVKDNGYKQKIVFRDKQGAILVDAVSLRQFCAARDLLILLQIDVRQYFNKSQKKQSKVIQESGLHASLCITDEKPFIGDAEALGHLIGKRIIYPLPKDKCGIWPFEQAKRYESFIIGVSEDGSYITNTSNPDELHGRPTVGANSHGYLTPVYFQKELLKKYLDKPSIYSVEDGYLRCGSAWGIMIDNNHEDLVVAYLGDLGRDLPECEQLHWRSFNIRPEGRLSQSYIKRSLLGEFAEPENIDHTIKHKRRKMLEQWQEAFGFSLYNDFHQDDKDMISDLRLPVSDEWQEFERCTMAAAKIFVDYLNEQLLEKGAEKEINKLKQQNPNRTIRGIDKLNAWLIQRDAKNAPIECADILRDVQKLRSESAAHRKRSSLSKFLAKHGLTDDSPREIYRCLVINPLLDYCIKLRAFAELEIKRSE